MAGVDVDARVYGSTSLHQAANHAQSQMVKLLLQYGTDKNATSLDEIIKLLIL